jgi:hypothetical protein
MCSEVGSKESISQKEIIKKGGRKFMFNDP